MRRLLLASLLLVVGCGAYSPGRLTTEAGGGSGFSGPGGSYGATVGGQKDIAQARALIASGQVPAPGLIATEGLLAEHDFATEGGACSSLFCARPAVARHTLRSTGKQELFVHVGMLSGLSADWQRPPADIMVAVDKGGSMSIDLKETLQGIALMIDRLRPDDRFGMVVFDDTAAVLIPLGPVTDKEATKAQVQNVGAAGGFAGVLDGAQLAFEALADARTEGRLSRMMFFACGLPPVGDARFDALVKQNADAGIGLSFFGILVGGSYESARYFSSQHGGNAFFLTDLERVKTVFDTDLDLIITPLAYDLKLKLEARGATVKRVWGLPQDKQELEAATVFPSRNRGAIVLQLEAPEGADLSSLVSMDVSYAPTLGAAAVQGASPLVQETRGGVRKAAAVVNLADGLVAALEQWQRGDHAAAKAAVKELRAYVDAEATALDDAGLRNEVALLDQLIANMK